WLIVTLFIGEDLNTQITVFIREQGQFKVINRTGCQGMGLRLKLEFTDGEFRQLATQLSGVQRTDLALALAALWLGRLCNR
ncbi:hypothetical protein, partial [Escherichia coli]|uniref:hypothetical protein n=1 Tax=Escherichia coli TaxID=562 RepID=UPI00186A6614